MYTEELWVNSPTCPASSVSPSKRLSLAAAHLESKRACRRAAVGSGAGFSDLWIEGEISDLRPAASGHIYFTLKDDSAQLSVVLFRSQAAASLPSGRWPAHLAARQLSVYEQRGQMQIVAEHSSPWARDRSS